MPRRQSERTRRRRGTGSISQRQDGRFSAEWPGPPRKRTTVATRQQAEAWLAQQAQPRADPRTFGSWLLHWYLQSEPGWSRSTALTYTRRIKRAAPLSGIQLADLRADHFRGLIADWQRSGRDPRYIRTVLGTLAQALERAVDDALIDRNPATIARRTYRAPRQPERAIWTEQQAAVFVGAIRGHRFEPLFLLALAFGLRIGELVALRWRDVDLRAGTVTVNQAWSEQALEIAPPKHGSVRRFVISPALVEVLATHRERAVVGLYVCSRDDGQHWGSNTVRLAFHQLCAEHGLPRIRLHDLRHFAASTLVNAGVALPRVAAVLGHRSISQTSRYSHANAGDEAAPAERMERLLQPDD